MLGQNNPIAGFVHILPNAGLYLTQHFYIAIDKYGQRVLLNVLSIIYDKIYLNDISTETCMSCN